jgi:hypothetical protein
MALLELTRTQLVAAMLLGVVVPAASWLDGSGGALAWTMFSKSETYRLQVNVTDGAGEGHIINPTELGKLASVDLATFLSGSESWRHGPVGAGLEHSLGGLAELACRLPGGSRAVRVRLETRRDLDAPVRVLDVARRCR